MGPIEPVRASGLNATSARMEFTVRVSAPRMQTPDGATDQAVMYAGAYLIGAFTNDFDVDELEPALRRNCDLDRVRDGLRRLRRDGSGADRQRACWAETGDLTAVVRDAARRTLLGG